MELGNNIINLSKKHGITPTQLARLCGVKQPTLHGWITGRKVKDINEVLKICNFFEVSLYSLLYGKPDPHEKVNEVRVLEELFKGEVKIIISRG